ncbi:cell envelope integrity protein TolA [Sutterella sp.]|uniref:cell envelope integrity protein TolA n=1 Tax=Sutterella sp. TaxID=1981025 RepID=UPI0025FDAC99|nr:cell envelope integrity protein TolA [uncultured Sutterella sp.]
MIKLTEEEAARERFRREDRRDDLPAAALSVIVHGVLFVGLFTVFQWNTSPETVYAELWATEDVSGGNDPQGVAEKLPEEKGRDETDAPEKKAAQPEPKPEKAPPPPEEKTPPAGPTPEEIAAKEAAEAQRLEDERIARAAQAEMEARRAEAERVAQERARAEEIERMRQEAIEAERRRALEEQKRLEEERLAQERLAEQARKAEEAKKAEEARRAEEARIAEEKRKAEAAKKAEEERLAAEAEAKRVAEELRRQEEQRVAEEQAKKAAAEKKAREEEQQRRRVAQRIREQELARLSAKVDPNAQRSGTTTGDQRNFKQNLTGSAFASWSNKVRACIRPHITIDVPANTPKGRYKAEFRLKLMPTGEQMGAPNLITPSGWSAYDAAVERAIRRCSRLPSPGPGEQMPREITLAFDPVEDKQ